MASKFKRLLVPKEATNEEPEKREYPKTIVAKHRVKKGY